VKLARLRGSKITFSLIYGFKCSIITGHTKRTWRGEIGKGKET
jgi:hypothetical protein